MSRYCGCRTTSFTIKALRAYRQHARKASCLAQRRGRAALCRLVNSGVEHRHSDLPKGSFGSAVLVRRWKLEGGYVALNSQTNTHHDMRPAANSRPCPSCDGAETGHCLGWRVEIVHVDGYGSGIGDTRVRCCSGFRATCHQKRFP